MFSKTRTPDTKPQSSQGTSHAESGNAPSPSAGDRSGAAPSSAAAPRQRTAPSLLSADLTVVGNIKTQGDIQVEGTIEGDVRAHQLTIGETATIKGEIIGDDVVVNGRIIGRVRGLRVRLSATARVEGDIIHKTIAIESGAHFEGSVQRQEDPIGTGDGTRKLAAPQSAASSAAE